MKNGINNRPIILVGKMGAGKTSVLEYLTKKLTDDKVVYKKITTYTTRERREGEDENAYHFVTNEEFDEMKANKEFAEFYESEKVGLDGSVMRVQYGSKKEDYIFDNDKNDRNIVDPVEVKIIILNPEGAKKAQKALGTDNCSVIVLQAWDNVLEQRCIERGTESVQEIKERLNREAKEFEGFNSNADLVVNNNFGGVQQSADLVDKYVRNMLQPL